VKCCLLDNIILQDSVAGTWFYKLDQVQSYYVKGVYNLLTCNDQQVQANT